MSTTEETVTAPTGKAAFDAARASLSAQSSDHAADTGEGNDTTPEATPTVEDPAPAADPPVETATTDDDGLLTAAEVEKLSEKERGLYEKAQKNYTLKTQKLAAERKDFEKWKPLIDAISADPEAAIRKLAEERGLKFAEPVTEDTTPEELKFLEPVLSARDKQLEAKIRAELAPLKEGMDRITSEAIAAETQADEAAFEAKYPDYRKLEPRMLELAQDFIPARKMEGGKYLAILRTLALAETSEAEKTKKVVEKINKAAANADPVESGIPNSRVEHAIPPPDKRSMRDAWEAAKRGERWVK